MGREIRRVPPNWEHPQETKYNPFRHQEETDYHPLHNEPYIAALNEWLKEHQQWEEGTHEALKEYSKEDYPHYADYGGDAPRHDYYRPNWKPEEMTWWQVYETVSEGTPVTPPFATQAELVEYLTTNGDFWDQKRRKEGRSIMNCEPWSREQAERFVYGTGWAPSLIGIGGNIEAGHRVIFPPQPA